MRELMAAGDAALQAAQEIGAEKALEPAMRLAFILISVALVVIAGLMSGLTIGLMAIDELALEVRGARGARDAPGVARTPYVPWPPAALVRRQPLRRHALALPGALPL